ncbi:hypothetical protein AAG906_012887 [Vitis piasezkii]
MLDRTINHPIMLDLCILVSGLFFIGKTLNFLIAVMMKKRKQLKVENVKDKPFKIICGSSEDFVRDSMGCDILDLQMEKRNLSMYHAIEEFIQAQNNPTPISNSYSKQQQNCSIASSFLTFRFPFPELCHRFGVQCTIIIPEYSTACPT